MATNYVGTNALTYLITKIKNALTLKVDKVDGKGLSTNDYTTTEKTALGNAVQTAKIGSAAVTKSGTELQLPAYPTTLPASDVAAWAKAANKPTYSKAEVGLGNADNTADASKNVLSATRLATARTINGVSFDGTANITVADNTKIPTSQRGVANGVATLDANGQVPSSQLPSFVDDVIEAYYNSVSDKMYSDSAKTIVITGESGKIYVDLTTNNSYRWSGSTYVQIVSSDLVEFTNSEIDVIWTAA